MTQREKSVPDVLIYPTSILDFEITVICLEESDAMVERAIQQCQSIQNDGYRVMALTDRRERDFKRMELLSASDPDFDTALVKFVNSEGRCAIVIDASKGISSPGALAALLGHINQLCITGGGVDWVSVLVPKEWKNAFLSTDPVVQAHAESVAEDLKYQAEQQAEKNAAKGLSSTNPRNVHDAPVTARVYLAGQVLKALINADPQSINENIFDKAADMADKMLLALADSRNANGVES